MPSSPTITPTNTCCATSNCISLENVVPVKKALAAETGTALFSMDGSLGAGLTDFTDTADKREIREVETISFKDACREFGVPAFVKMDIEGAEVAVISDALAVSRTIASNLPSKPSIASIANTLRPHHAHALRHRLQGLVVVSFSGQQFTWAPPASS